MAIKVVDFQKNFPFLKQLIVELLDTALSCNELQFFCNLQYRVTAREQEKVFKGTLRQGETGSAANKFYFITLNTKSAGFLF